MHEQQAQASSVSVAFPSLRRARFRSWLVAHSSSIVGFTSSDTDCPLACWLYDTTGVRYLFELDRYTRAGSPFVKPLPAWCRAFIRSLDFTCPLTSVTGEQALAFLDALSTSAVLAHGEGMATLPYLYPVSDDDCPSCSHGLVPVV